MFESSGLFLVILLECAPIVYSEDVGAEIEKGLLAAVSGGRAVCKRKRRGLGLGAAPLQVRIAFSGAVSMVLLQ